MTRARRSFDHGGSESNLGFIDKGIASLAMHRTAGNSTSDKALKGLFYEMQAGEKQ